MALAGTLEIQIITGLARLTTDMGMAQGTVKSAMREIEGAVSSAKSVLASLGIGLSVGYFASLMKGSIDAADHLQDLSKATNITVEDLAGLRIAAKQSGGDLDSISDSVLKLSVNMGKAPERFAALGVSAKSPLEAFKQLSNIFVSLEDTEQRNAVMAEALGKSWKGAAPLLAEGGDKIGEIVTKGSAMSGVTAEMAKQADQFNDKLVSLTGTGGLITRAVGPLLPLLNMLADEMMEAQKNTASLNSGFNPLLETFRALIIFGGNVAFTFKAVGIEIGGIAAQFAAFWRGDFKQFAAIHEDMVERAKQARVEFDAWEKGVLELGTGMKAAAPAVAGMTDEQKKAAAAAAAAAAAFLHEGNAAADLTKELQKLLDLDMKNRLAGIQAVMDADDEFYRTTAALADARNKDAERLRALDLQGWVAYAEARIDEDFRMAEQLAKDQIDAAEKIKAAQKKIDDDRLREQKRQADEIERLLGDALMRGFEAGKDWATAFRDSLVNMFKTLVLKPVIQFIISPISGAITAGLSSLGVSGTANAASGISGLSNLFSGMPGTTMLSGLVQDIGVSIGSQVVADFGTFLAESGISAAMPYVGIGLAAASALGLFSGHTTVQGSGSASVSTAGTFSNAAGQIHGGFDPTSVMNLASQSVQQFAAIVSALGGTITQQFGLGVGQGGGGEFNVVPDIGGRQIYDRAGLTAAGAQTEAARAMLVALQQAAEFSDDIKQVFAALDATTATPEQINAAIAYATALRQTADATVAATAAANAQIAVQRDSLQEQLDVVTGARTQQQIDRQHELATALDPANAALMQQIFAQQDLAVATAAATEAADAEAEAARQRKDDQYAAEQEQAAYLAQMHQAETALGVRWLRATGQELAALNMERAAELAALQPELRELQQLVWLRQDEAAITAAATNSAKGFADAMRTIRMGGMTPEQQYGFLGQEATSLQAMLTRATDPTQIANLSQQLLATTMQAYGILSPEQQNYARDAFLSTLQHEADLTQVRYDAATAATEAALQHGADGMKKAVADGVKEGMDAWLSAQTVIANAQQNAADTMLAAAQAIPGEIKVSVQVDGNEVGG